MKNLLCYLGFHVWESGKCHCVRAECLALNPDDGSHDWTRDCECCRRYPCGKTRVNGHKWDGCKCSNCGKTRDEGHKWAGCKCSVCQKTRDEEHIWQGCRCSVCRKTRDQEHTWQGCKCSVCGKTQDTGHDWSKDCQKCARCSQVRNAGHEWSDGKCSKCGVRECDWKCYKEGHKWIQYGEGRKCDNCLKKEFPEFSEWLSAKYGHRMPTFNVSDFLTNQGVTGRRNLEEKYRAARERFN